VRLFFILLLFPAMVIAQAAPDRLDVTKSPSSLSLEQDSSAKEASSSDGSKQQQQSIPEKDDDFTPSEEISEDFPVSIPYDI
tara:strand:- start:3503 stop:3748 length:246 start_codon:yes stop_codon:yes gene_type:complete